MNLKILLINNKEFPQLGLEKFLRNYGTVTTIHFQSISILSILKTYVLTRPDLIIMAGAGEVPVGFSLDLYRDELELIKTSRYPIIGICFGFEIIAAAYDEKMIKGNSRVSGIFDVEMNDREGKIKVWQSHLWNLPKADQLEVLGTSQNGLCVVKVPDRDIFGIQFHPDYIHEENQGSIIFDEIVKRIFEKE